MILSNQFLIQILICCFLSRGIKCKDLFKPYLIIAYSVIFTYAIFLHYVRYLIHIFHFLYYHKHIEIIHIEIVLKVTNKKFILIN